MSIRATCPACGASYELADRMRGTHVRCRGCRDPFLVGGADDVAPAEDADRPRKRRRAPEEGEEGGSSPLVWVAVAVGGALVLVVGVCAGVIWYVSTSVGNAVDRAVERVKNAPPPAAFQARPGPQPGAQPVRPVTDLDDALARLRSAAPAERAEGARWLGRQPADRARREEVVQALRPLLTDPDFDVRIAANQAFVTWHQALP